MIEKLALEGSLSNDEFMEYLTRIPYMDWYGVRDCFVKNVSWAVFMSEWLRSMLNFFVNKRVLEVCVGNDVIGRWMRRHGVDWVSTDFRPRVEGVTRCGARQAVDVIEHDVVFASWIQYDAPWDHYLSCRSPGFFVGEGQYRCTGSQKFWGSHRCQGGKKEIVMEKPYDIIYLGTRVENFVDVPNWPGIHDFTFMTVPWEEASLQEQGVR